MAVKYDLENTYKNQKKTESHLSVSPYILTINNECSYIFIHETPHILVLPMLTSYKPSSLF